MHPSTISGQRRILIATTNSAKFAEIKEYLSDFTFLPTGRQVELVSLQDVGILQEVEEDGATYEENSQKKALEYAKLSGLPAISDDGGLEIAALDGAPGVNARYFGDEKGTDEAIIEKMKQVIKNAGNNRGVLFVGVNTLALPTGEFWSARADVHLELARVSSNKIVKGFPYRSFLVLPGTNKYFHESELTEQERKKYNHRYKALQQLRHLIVRKLGII